MRSAVLLLILIIAQAIWGVNASSQTPSASPERPLTLIPTALQELNELRVNTGTKAVLNDGTMGAVYVKQFPAQGSTYLNLHVDLSSRSGRIVLRAGDIRLEGAERALDTQHVDGSTPNSAPGSPEVVSYTPMDWFVDTGFAEVRGDSLTVEKAIVQFTIEVPRAGLDDLILSVKFQRIGTVREIRERIVKDGEPNRRS